MKTFGRFYDQEIVERKDDFALNILDNVNYKLFVVYIHDRSCWFFVQTRVHYTLNLSNNPFGIWELFTETYL